MAVVLVGVTPAFHGLAADTKPTLTASAAGASFLATDTGDRFVWDGSAWQPRIRSIGGDLWP